MRICIGKDDDRSTDGPAGGAVQYASGAVRQDGVEICLNILSRKASAIGGPAAEVWSELN